MRFARVGSAFVLLVLVLTPVKHALRGLGVAPAPGQYGFSPLLAGLEYLILLVALYGLITVVLWAFRSVLLYAEAWTQFGLADLDVGVCGVWPYRWFVVLAVFLLVAAATAESGLSSLVEALAACAVVFVALLGPPAAPNPVDEYDPLPIPSPSPTPEPVPSPEPTPQPPVPKPEDLITLAMSWYFRKEPGHLGLPSTAYQILVNASRSRYNALVAKDHGVCAAADYGRFVRDGLTPEVEDTARAMRRISGQDRLGTIAEINNVLAFAQRFKYAQDSEDKGVSEYPKYPLETMVEDRGDCEDHAILAAACLVRLGYDVRLVLLKYGSGLGHMALAVAGAEGLPDALALRDPVSGRTFYYCEATTDAGSRDPNAVSFRMGEIPSNDRRAQMELVSVT